MTSTRTFEIREYRTRRLLDTVTVPAGPMARTRAIYQWANVNGVAEEDIDVEAHEIF